MCGSCVRSSSDLLLRWAFCKRCNELMRSRGHTFWSRILGAHTKVISFSSAFSQWPFHGGFQKWDVSAPNRSPLMGNLGSGAPPAWARLAQSCAAVWQGFLPPLFAPSSLLVSVWPSSLEGSLLWLQLLLSFIIHDHFPWSVSPSLDSVLLFDS